MDLATNTIVIPAWANGPDGSANGGWTAGLLAQRLDAPSASVSLRVPPPIGRPLQVEHVGATVELRDGDVLVADVSPGWPSFDVPSVVRSISVDTAQTASDGFPFRERHPFPHCIACGIERSPEEPSLGIHCGPVDGVQVTDEAGDAVPVFADAWIPTADLADPDEPDLVCIEGCWSSLDCPSATPFADPQAERPSVLARITARMLVPALVGEPHVLVAWRLAVDGRKQRSASVLLDSAGMVLGVAEALWIEVRSR